MTEDLFPIYLLHFPEEEQYVHEMDIDGKMTTVIELDCTLRYSQWCLDEGYIDEEDHQRCVSFIEQLRTTS